MQPIETRLQLKTLPAAGWEAPKPADKLAELRAQVDEFATVLYAQMFAQVREAAKGDDEEGGLFGGDMELFSQFFDREVGRTFAAQGGDALKANLLMQLERRLGEQDKAPGGQP